MKKISIERSDSKILLKDLVDKNQEENAPLIVAAKVNNKLKELTYEFEGPAEVELVDLTVADGVRIYQRGISYVLIRAAKEVFDGIQLKLSHSLSKGLFFHISYERSLNKGDILKIKEKMKEIIDNDEKFVKMQVSSEDAKKLFEELNMDSKKDILDYRKLNYINMYENGWMKNHFYGYMVPSTGYLKLFELILYDEGIILRHPTKTTPLAVPEFVESPNIAKIFAEYSKWASIMNCSYVSNLNKIIQEGKHKDIMLVAEALQTKKIVEIAGRIVSEEKRLILIAGPSSSGKTTFANRLRTQLMVSGLEPITLSTDDYFVDRDFTPIDENGEYDFESIDAVDLKLFNKDLNALLDGERVLLPEFNFKLGQKEYHGRELQVRHDQPIIIEGIHGLNPRLTSDIFEKEKFKIYISALTQLNIDRHNRIPTTDARLIRRIVRDHNYRDNSARVTLKQWASVRRGEEKNIFPYQEDSDVMFNSAIVYELAIMKKHVEPLLLDIGEDEETYTEALRVLKFLQYFESIEDDELIPNNSILKEFIGGSIFR